MHSSKVVLSMALPACNVCPGMSVCDFCVEGASAVASPWHCVIAAMKLSVPAHLSLRLHAHANHTAEQLDTVAPMDAHISGTVCLLSTSASVSDNDSFKQCQHAPLSDSFQPCQHVLFASHYTSSSARDQPAQAYDPCCRVTCRPY